MAGSIERPIFLLGISERSGTNYLFDLVTLHEDCAPGRAPVAEDFFLHHVDVLDRYVDAVAGSWMPEWGDYDDDIDEQLLAGLGRGLISFLTVDPTRRLVTKTPSPRHIDRFPVLFPDADLAVLVRDGRSVVHSAMATFGWDVDHATRRWTTGAAAIRAFVERGTNGAARLVRYEDLVDDPGPAMSDLFTHFGLDRSRYDYDAARTLPVRGSSSLLEQGHDAVHWRPVPTADDFTPKERWRSWPDELLERVEWLAGDHLRYFGYELATDGGDEHRVRHHVLDARAAAARGIRQAERRARETLGPRLRPLRARLRGQDDT